MKIKKYTRVTAFFLAVCTVLLMLPLSVRADEYWPDGVKTQSKSAIVMEVNTGTVLYEKKSHEKHYPASITKIMTVLLAIENCDMDEVVTFSADAVFKNEGDTSHIARNLGEKLTMEQCLYAVMLESANECAYAVAEHVGQKLGGDYRTFIDRMNKRAKELGCTDTHFNNCNGLPDEDHWVSAYDMALISAEAYKNETFRMIAGSPSYTLPKTNKCKAEYPCHNHHKMIYPFRGDSSHLYKYCTGGKTGYTTVANNTLVSFAEKDGITLVCVVMDAATPDHYTDTRKLFDYCFENFQALNISENDAGLAKDNGKNYGVLNNSEPYVKLDEDAYIIMPKGAQFSDASYKKTESAKGKNYGVLNNSEPYVKLDEDAYIIMPKGAQFSDVSYKKTESAKGKKKVARLAYTYAGHEVGSVDIVKTGAKVKDNYYVNTDSGQKKNERVIRIDPAWLIVAGVVIVAAVVLLFLAKRAYDNFYVIRHQRKTKKNDKMRFREKKRKKYNRRKDRFF